MGKGPLVDSNSLKSFIFFQYKPFKGKDLLRNVILIMSSCAIFYKLNANKQVVNIMLALGIVCVFSCVVSFAVMPNSPKTRFINDGVIFSFFSIIINLESSQMIAGGRPVLRMAVFLFALLLSAIAYIWISVSNIKKNKYNGEKGSTTSETFSLAGAIIGFFGIMLFSRFLPSERAENAVAYLLFILSLLLNIGVVSFFKLYCFVHTKNGSWDS